MRVLVRHGPPLRHWHVRLGERLEAAGHAVAFEAVGPRTGCWLSRLERRLYGIEAGWDADILLPLAGEGGSRSETDEGSPRQGRDHPNGQDPSSDPATRGHLLPQAGEGKPATNLTIKLAGPLPTFGSVIHFDIAGWPDEAGIAAAARSGTAPLVRVFGGPADAPRLLATGRPAIEDPRVAARAIEGLLPRLVTLLVQAVARLSDGTALPNSAADPASRPASAAAFFARGVAAKVARRFGRAEGRPDHWQIALRRSGDADWRPVPDEPARFHADPFLFEEDGKVWRFTEDFSYADGKGVIAARAVDGTGHRTVLEEVFHLSYPLVLRHRGTIYMLPEAARSGRLRLYRAERFPDCWLPDAVLVEGRLGDATPVLHEGRWWLFATAFDDGGSSWDQLHLWQAPDLLGPWTPHAGNPVLIDAGAARPAGAMWHEDGVLMRPAQDCRAGYGGAVAVCRVDRLDEDGFAQTVVRRIEPPPGATGLHTINRAGGWEACDLKVPHPVS